MKNSVADQLWSEAKETESLNKLLSFLNQLPPSERRDSILAKTEHELRQSNLRMKIEENVPELAERQIFNDVAKGNTALLQQEIDTLRKENHALKLERQNKKWFS